MTKWLLIPATIMAVLALAPAANAVAAKHKVEITERKFKPAKIKVKKGDTVVWTNNGEGDHTVTAKDEGESFDSGKIAVGEAFEHTFEKAGKYEYVCDYHPRMKGVVEVTD
jgi:plastocyanin